MSAAVCSQAAEVFDELGGFTTEQLLDAVIALTHKLHTASRNQRDAYRDQRARASLEILRRAAA